LAAWRLCHWKKRVIFLSVLSFLATMDFAHPWVHAQSSNVIFGASGDYGYNSNTQLTFSKMGSSSLNFALALGDLSYNQGSAQPLCGAFRQQIKQSGRGNYWWKS